ncbi:transporter substrate-binding protein [Rhodobacterales bacterium]|nr:transporter substrate-binding protein [Rhodobacterales bacterium]
MKTAPWRVGVLFSKSGVTEITETEHLQGTLLAIEEINAAGGVGGRLVEPVVYDPEADSAMYRHMARDLLAEEEVNVIFGCSMSASRKAVLPIMERHNGLLFYPSMYEGFEYSENVVYTGATLNQNTFALADFLLQSYGKRIYITGSDYIYPRESNRVMRDLIEAKGGEVVAETYLPIDADPRATAGVIEDIQRHEPDAIFSTVIGRSARHFYTQYDAAGFDRHRNPIASLTMAETEIGAIGAERCDGHILAATYMHTLKDEATRRFVSAFQQAYGPQATTSIWSQTAYLQVHLFARALARTGSTDAGKISDAVLTETFAAPGDAVSFDAQTRHLFLTPRLGVARRDGLFDIEWEASTPVRPDPYLVMTRFEETWLSA